MAGKKGQINRNVQKCKTSCEIITGFKLGQVDKLLKTISAVLYAYVMQMFRNNFDKPCVMGRLSNGQARTNTKYHVKKVA